MSGLGRRALLKFGVLGAAQTAIAQTAGVRSSATRDARRNRLGVATWPFRGRILAPKNTERVESLPGFDLAGFADFVVREFDVPGIEPLDQHFPSTTTSYMHELRAHLDRIGARVINIPIDEPVDLGSDDAAVRNQGYAVYRQWIDHAVILGSPSIRIAVPKCGGPTDIAGPAKALAPVAKYGATRNVMVHLENDDPVLGNAARIVAILRAANNPNLRALPDFGNSLMGGDDAFNTHAVESMFAFSGRIAHVKDAEEIEGKHRTAPLPPLFAIARRANYTGAYSMESDSHLDPVPDTRRLIEQSLALL